MGRYVGTGSLNMSVQVPLTIPLEGNYKKALHGSKTFEEILAWILLYYKVMVLYRLAGSPNNFGFQEISKRILRGSWSTKYSFWNFEFSRSTKYSFWNFEFKIHEVFFLKFRNFIFQNFKKNTSWILKIRTSAMLSWFLLY